MQLIMRQLNEKRQKLLTIVIPAFFLLLTVWWLWLRFVINDTENIQNQTFAAVYGVMALSGGLIGLYVAKKWGGLKSVLGKSLVFFSLGLFMQEFGQLAYSYYIYFLKQDIPYPSIGDIGYFGSIPLYICGAILLARASGASFSMKSFAGKIQAFIIPLILLVVSYYMFLRGYEFDWSQPMTVFLDFGYPLGQAVYISIALLAFLFSRKLLGGVLRSKILLVLFALSIQYAADFTFLYQTHHETWSAGGINDYMYLVSYFVMTLALLGFANLYEKLQASSTTDQIGAIEAAEGDTNE